MGQGSCKGFTGCGDVGAGHGGGVTIHTVAKGTGAQPVDRNMVGVCNCGKILELLQFVFQLTYSNSFNNVLI